MATDLHAVQSLAELWTALTRPGALVEFAVLLACLGLTWLVVRGGARRDAAGRVSIFFGARGYDGVLYPMTALLLVLAARWALNDQVPIALLRVAVPVLLSLAVIRLVAQVLRRAFPGSGLVRAMERSFSWIAWIAVVLWVTNLLPLLLTELDSISWHIGGEKLSLRRMLEGALTAGGVLVLALWLSAALESRLLSAPGNVDLSVRKIAANGTRAVLLLVGLLLALSAAGIPLTALSVLGGALGVGIGLGLQRLAANYVSGFVILAERSLRIGDVVKVDNFEGRITDIKTRYTVIRSPTGRESIVPNEMLITQRVESNSLADPKVALTSSVQVAYGTDLASLMPALVGVMLAVPRVLAEPAPSVQLTAFAADGLELTLVFWIDDSHNGTGNVRSEVNLAVLAALNVRGVEIPFPQRVVHQA
ncbi:MAG: mechanosensitive ion channel family protein [Aquabacterium sp.]